MKAYPRKGNVQLVTVRHPMDKSVKYCTSVAHLDFALSNLFAKYLLHLKG